MNISSVCIQNFRKLYQCHIDFSNDTTLFVGANNSGKTSAMDALGKFLAGRPFAFNDITISNRELINQIGKQWETVACEKPNSLSEWGNLLPSLDVWLNVNPQDIHYVVGIIPTLKWRGGRLGVRLIYQPRKIEGLFTEYREAFFSARETEKAGAAEKKIRLFPNSLCEYLERYFTSSFVVKSYILDPEKFDADSPQETAFGMECLVDNPLTGIIRIDTIGAQRNLSDPEKHDGTDSDRTRLSTKIRSYYDKYLDPEKTPLPEDLEILAATEQARKIFDNNLENKFKPAIKELEELGYPGIANPRITITSKVTTTEMLRHDSAVQYSLGEKGDGLILPEKYNGLGYQNLISIVFDLISYRDGWMRAGKSGTKDEIIEPLHLVLVEEPEAHLHVQVQQVFIRKAYSVLRNHEKLGKSEAFSTQLVISTHSSHIHKSSPLLSKKSMSANIGAQQEMLEKAEQASASLFALWDNDANPLCIEVLKNINASGLYELTERTNDILDENYVGDDPKVIALKKALSVPFDEMERYATYVSDSSRFATHQGVKGLEFPRVMVILDDTESRGFLFSYEKLFGAKKQTATDLKNEKEGKDTSNRRTARLFYVACTRAMESLAVVAYSDNPELVKNTALNNGWFSEDEIQIIETQSVL